MRNSLTDF